MVKETVLNKVYSETGQPSRLVSVMHAGGSFDHLVGAGEQRWRN